LKTQVEIAYDKHEQWLEIVNNFGNIKETEAEDIVQLMYISLHKYTQKGLNFMYNEKEVNYWYIYRILRGLYIDLIRKKSKVTILELDGGGDLRSKDHRKIQEYLIQEKTPDYVTTYEEVKDALKNMYWYDAKVYEIIEGGESISELSRKTNISYYSLYNTYRKVKEKLKQYI
jgi:DNA-directed RNA polymerase specialized sigma24 family protein